MRHYRATAAIHAAPEVIWKILTDAGGYPRWDQTMDRIEGQLALGETVKFFTKLSPSAFPVKVTACEDGTTTFTTEESFSGLLLPLFGRSIPDLTENFLGFVAPLKRQAEQ